MGKNGNVPAMNGGRIRWNLRAETRLVGDEGIGSAVDRSMGRADRATVPGIGTPELPFVELLRERHQRT